MLAAPLQKKRHLKNHLDVWKINLARYNVTVENKEEKKTACVATNLSEVPTPCDITRGLRKTEPAVVV